MCLLIVATGVRPDLPLIVGANRDEFLERPATAMEVLDPGPPRILGGRDLLAGGTWLAVNDHGVVAGLTNRPRQGKRDPTKRSRGELPLALAAHTSAGTAVEAFLGRFQPSEYNPGWLLVADRGALFSIDMTEGARPEVVEQPAGIHVLENCPPGTESPKVVRVRSLLTGLDRLPGPEVIPFVTSVLADHEIPSANQPGNEDRRRRAACVHGEKYGTRWSAVLTLGPSVEDLTFRYAGGPPCETSFSDAYAAGRV